MIQKGTKVRVVDNSGARHAYCIHVYNGYRRRYAGIGDLIKVAITNTKKKENVKIQKGDTSKAIVISTNNVFKNFRFFMNSVALISSQEKFIGSRLFVPITPEFKSTRFLKLLLMASGVLKT